MSEWSPRAGLDATYTDNVDKDDAGRDAFWADGVLGLGWFRRGPRFEGTADYQFQTPLHQSDRVDDRDGTRQRVFGAAKWRAAEHLRLSGNAQAAQDLESNGAFGGAAPGIPSTYANRTDRYSGEARYDWTVGSSVTNAGSYRYGYTNYVSDASEGQDSRTHRVTEDLGIRASGRDRLGLRYTYDSDDDVDGEFQRENHFGEVTWSRELSAFPARDTAQVRAACRAERVLYAQDDTDDYWDTEASVGYSQALSQHTRIGLDGGYQRVLARDDASHSNWTARAEIDHRFGPRTHGRADVAHRGEYLPDTGEFEKTVQYAASLDHVFSRYTTGRLAVSQGWEYQAPTSTSSNTVLTRRTQADGSLSARLSERLTATAGAGASRNDPADTGVEAAKYWDANGDLQLTGTFGETGFAGVGLDVLRRRSDDVDDSYWLGRLRVFLKQQLAGWLTANAQYTREHRRYDAASQADSYVENRATVSIVASW